MSRPRLSKQRQKTQHQPRRRGVVVVCVVTCLIIATLMLGGMLKSVLLSKRQIRTEWHLRQAQWLVQAGVERAAFRLTNEAGYTGEQWQLQADAIVGMEPGVVRIEVRRESAGRANVRVVAEYPTGGSVSIRRTQKFLIDLPQE